VNGRLSTPPGRVNASREPPAASAPTGRLAGRLLAVLEVEVGPLGHMLSREVDDQHGRRAGVDPLESFPVIGHLKVGRLHLEHQQVRRTHQAERSTPSDHRHPLPR
jgi:hypothetical protein